VERFGRIDVLVNTVGAWRGGVSTHEAPLADWDFLFAANVRPTLLACRAVAPHFVARRGGRIINVAARSGLHGDAGSAAYSAAKSAVLRLTESLSAELKSSGVNVNAVLPSTIDTPQNRAAMPGADFSMWVQPDAIADVIVFLASDAARAIHGAAIPVYGLS
jgi:NAD(P)-dependent dehydrogenase (short-subunit alcohol dehydrogenase family)